MEGGVRKGFVGVSRTVQVVGVQEEFDSGVVISEEVGEIDGEEEASGTNRA